MLRLLIAEDLDYLREELVTLLNSSPWIKVVGTAANGQEAVDLCRSLQPNGVLIDAEMPLVNGFDLTAYLHDQYPSMRVVIFSTSHLRRRIESDGAGGNPFLLQRKTLNQIARTIRSLY